MSSDRACRVTGAHYFLFLHFPALRRGTRDNCLDQGHRLSLSWQNIPSKCFDLFPCCPPFFVCLFPPCARCESDSYPHFTFLPLYYTTWSFRCIYRCPKSKPPALFYETLPVFSLGPHRNKDAIYFIMNSGSEVKIVIFLTRKRNNILMLSNFPRTLNCYRENCGIF